MSAGNRLLLAALALSAGLHGLMLAGLSGWTPAPAPEPALMPLEARLLPPPAPAVPPAVQMRAQAKVHPPARRARPAAEPTPAPSPRNEIVAVAAAPGETPQAAPGEADEPADDAAAQTAQAVGPAAEPPAESPSDPAPALAHAEYPLRHVRLVYDLLHSESQTRIGHVIHTFQSDGGRYAAQTIVEAVGFVSLFYRGRFVQRSHGLIGPDGLVPEEYTLERGGGDPPERARFDWDLRRLELAWRNERRSLSLPGGAQDPISVLHQIYFMQPMPASVRLNVATGRKLGAHTYALLGEEDLLTPMGLVRTIHVGRVAGDGSVLEVWLDRDRELLPARVYSRDRKGTILDQVVREAALVQ